MSKRSFRTPLLLIALAVSIVTVPVFAGENTVQWDAKHSEELAHALHHMHNVWNSGDIPALKRLMKGDDTLVSFELDPHTHAPIRLRSKAEIDRFVDDVVVAIGDESATTQLEMPAINCKATDSFGVCTEECTVHFLDKAGKVFRTDKLLSTAVAVKETDGWKWIQWHMSVAQPTVPLVENRAGVAAGGGH